MLINDILSRFDGVKETTASGNVVRQYMARCPAHTDERQSLAIAQDKSGKILINCHANCDLEKILSKVNLTEKDLFPETEKERDPGKVSVKYIEYTYGTDADGKPAVVKVRKQFSNGDKDFYWKQRINGKWEYKQPKPPPLFGTDFQAEEGQTFIVEGEKDVQTMQRLGFPCVSLPDGASSKYYPEYDSFFAGKDLYLIPDNDDPGRDFMDNLVKNLLPIAKKVVQLDLKKVWPEIPEKGDISDLVQAKGEEAAGGLIFDLVAHGEPITEPKKEQATEEKEERYSAISAADFGEDNTSFVWYPYIPVGDYTVLMAPGGTGKTYFICGIAAAISKGKALPGGNKPKEPGTVLIISAEDRGELLKKRLEASGADLSRVLIIDCLASVGMSFSDGYDDFKATIQRYSPKLVIIDPWHGFLGVDVDINRVNAVRPVFQRLANMAKDCGCGMILISHVNKRAQGENVNNAATGSTDFVNAARSALYIIFDEMEQDKRIVVHTKSNYARYGPSIRFHIKDGGIVWDGFSNIDRQTMEQAARQKKTPGEVISNSEKKAKSRASLIRALMQAANAIADVRFTYDEFREQFGEDIFGSLKPKYELDSIADDMRARGFELKTGILVKRNKKQYNGFLLRPVKADSDSKE